MAFLTVEDLLGTVEVVVFPRDYEKNREELEIDHKVFIRGKCPKKMKSQQADLRDDHSV